MKIRIRRSKKWNELTDKEKLEYLKMEQEDSSMSTWQFLLILLTFVLLLISMTHVSILKWQVGDLYEQLKLSPMENTTMETDALLNTLSKAGTPLMWVFSLLVAIYLLDTAWHIWKWRKFQKSIRRN
jgi:flagellar biosynthesis protein FlhB